MLFSSGDFSFLLVSESNLMAAIRNFLIFLSIALIPQTYASFMRCFGFGLLNYKMWSSKTAKGVSLKTLELYALTFSVRLLSIMRHQGYLPFDKSGDWFYHTVSSKYHIIAHTCMPDYLFDYDLPQRMSAPLQTGSIS